MEEIVIPNFDDDDDDYLSSLPKPSFGAAASSSTTSLPETDPYSHRSNPSSDSSYAAPKLATTPNRPTLPKASASYSVGAPTPNSHGFGFGATNSGGQEPRLGKFSNGSSSSLVGPGTSIGSSSGFLAGRKGSLASLKNAFKSSNNHAVPPVPPLDTKQYSAPGYPALKNPFSRFDSPISPKHATFKSAARSGKAPSTSSPAAGSFHNPDGRKYSIASSHRSQGGRSNTSQGSSSFRAEDHHLPALPPIPMRQTPSRMGRKGSDAGSVFGFTSRRTGSIGGEDSLDTVIGKTPGEEALRVVFRDFRESANQKISRLWARPLNSQPSLSTVLEANVDLQFDSLINSLAHCGNRHARRVVDILMSWCRDHCGNIGASEVRAHLDRSLGLQMRVEDAAAILQARKSSAARYIMNRALIELLKVVPKDSLDQELGMSLEQNAFNAYRSEKLDEIMQFPHRKAVSQLQIELLGQLSNTRFLTVSDRFIRELSKYAGSTQPTKEAEARIEHLLKGMRYLKLRVYPEEELEMSSEFIQSLASFFANTHGQTLKVAYAETFTSLLHPVIETATAEVNHPQWSRAVSVILDRAVAMTGKQRYWAAAFPLVVTALGVSPREVFMQQWQPCFDAVMVRFKDRQLRPIAIGAIVRLLWIYLNRCSESSTTLRKRLDPLIRTCFPSGTTLYPPEIPSEPFIAMLHYIMTRHLDYGEEFVSEFLRDRRADNLISAERSTVLVRAVNYTLRSVELEKSATWPQTPEYTTFDLEGFEASGESMTVDAEVKPELHELLERCGPAFIELLFQCDNAVKHLLLSTDAVTLSNSSSSAAMDTATELVTAKHGDVYAAYPARYESTFRLTKALLDTLPRCMPSDVNFPQLANVLCRGTFSVDPDVCASAGDAIRRMAQNPERCVMLSNIFREFIFETRHVFRDTFIGTRLLESQFERIITLWLDLLRSLVGHQRVAEARSIDDDEGSRIAPIEPSQISKIEGCALFLLCSTALPIRKLATEILVTARDLEGQQRRPSAAFRISRISPEKSALTRVLQILDYTADEADVAGIKRLPWMSTSDRYRFDLFTAKDKNKLLRRIAESEHTKDGLLWLAILPYFVGKVAEQLPGPAQELRAAVSHLVLRLQAHVALVATSGIIKPVPGRSTSLSARNTMDLASLAEHWRAYMSVLCVTMGADGAAPATPPVQRTKDIIIINHESINSPGLFQYLTSLLAWDDPRFKDAAVYALGSIGQNHLRPLSETLLSVVRRLADGTKVGNPREGSRRSTANGPIWTAVAHVFRLISPLILDAKSSSHLTNLSSMIGFVKVTYTLLSDRAVKEDYDLQSLRRSFCITVENLTNALGKLDSSDRFLGEEVRGAVFKLCYEWCHVGRRPDVAKARESHTLQAAADGYRGDRDRGQYLDDLQAKTKLLSAAAAEAMAGLCQGKLISAADATPASQTSDHIVEPLTVLRWIRGMFSSSSVAHHETGRRALFALLKYNWTYERLLDEVLHQSFGEGEQFLLESSFFGVVADVLAEGLLKLPIEQVTCLSLSKLGHPVAEVRQRAYQLSVSLLDDPTEKIRAAIKLPGIGSTSANIYRHAQEAMSTQLAAIYADRAFEFLAECTTRLSQLEAPRRQATLSILAPWMAYLDLASDTSELNPEDAAIEHQALHNLVYLGVRFSDDHLDIVKRILTTFAGSEAGHTSNTTALVKFLFEQGGRRKSPDFVAHAQKIMACLAQSSAGDTIFEEICNFVEPSAMAALPEADVPPSPMSSLVNLDTIMSAPSARSQTFSTGQLALLFAGELLPHRLDDIELVQQLPTLLHAAFIHCDHASPVLRDQGQLVFFQVLRSWITDVSNVPTEDAATIWTNAEHKITALARARTSSFWKADDMGTPESTFLAPPKMTNLIMKILGILLPLQPRIRQQWGELALTWATSCPIRHLACRSFQVFRILSPRVNPRMVSDTLARLSSTIGSSSPEIQTFNQEVLRTFASIVQSLTAAEAFSYPQIFWCSVACLTTPFESEFTEVIELLSHVLDKTNLADPALVQQLVSFRPADWVGPPPYLQSLLLVGLRSSKTAFMTFDLIRRLTSAPHDDLIDPPSDRLLHGFVAALPWMLHSTDLGEPNEELASMALDLASIADAQGNASFSRLLTSFARVRFRSKDDFIRQAASLLRDYMSTHALEIVTLLLGFVLNSHDWMREKSMQILKLVLQSPEARMPLQTHGSELLQPLLRLVSTKHASQALDVLDMPVTASATAEPLAHGGASPGSTGEIFGSVVEESGWSVPKSKELSNLTRENVHAVFNTCAVETRAASAHFSVVQFADMRGGHGFGFGFGGGNPSQISLGMDNGIPSPPMTGVTIGGMDNASMGDLVGALHSLGQFFDDGLAEATSPKASFRPSGGGRHAASGSDVSDRRVRAIMARGHQASISSPIYETSSPSANGLYHRSKHQHSISTSESSVTSSMDERENVTQRLNFSPLGARGASGTETGYVYDQLGGGAGYGGGGQSRSGSNINLAYQNSQNGFGLGVGVGGRHYQNQSMSSMSDVADQSAFGLEDETQGGGDGSMSMFDRSRSPPGRSEQNTPVGGKRAARFGVPEGFGDDSR
ncbi:hypothetical protein CI109_100199 [Kwoniella shandongensis]|uniref:Uncharacterized protein n=1 Tax=Kwoniella shandongensis TaxID=1734106 RepID=A0A5M6BWX7_9TREE|nr:uncharacterized protein CI109_005798 [Kwoniella shandongensis]KAA5525915.1 hypothetical protein CI109_005798 [Kwoniella shandongensis]